MSACESVREQIQARLDGLLHHEAAEVDAHVAACAGCAAELRTWNELLSSLENMPPVEAPPGFAESVMADLPEMLPAREGQRTVASPLPIPHLPQRLLRRALAASPIRREGAGDPRYE